MPIRIQRYIAILSVVLFLGKLWAWYLTSSVAILTDALESTVNVITGFIGLYSVMLAAKPRDTNHPYGHGKVEFISSAIEGALIGIAGLFIIYEAVAQLHYPRAIEKLNTGIIITLIAGVINFVFGRYAVSVGKKNRSLTVEAGGRHLLSDAYSTIAIVIGLLLLLFTGWQWLDSAIAILFSGFIIVTGYKVLRRSLAGIMDEADLALLKNVVKVLQAHRRAQWIDLHNLRVVQYGEVLHIDAHMTLPWYYRVAAAEKEIHALEELIRRHFGGKVELFIHIDGCMPYSCKLCAIENCPVRQEAFKGHIEWNLENVWANKKHGEISN
ncbi:MAG TPA: cation diffusion facilitator family transporter [Flavipsychrobacter sp.]|nr:cation diffusion facilitator family transporter [Flavipsychrobacter sp.]